MISGYHYLAIFDGDWPARLEDCWLEQELLNYLDDRHQPVDVLRLKRLPDWIQKSGWTINLYLGLRLIFAPKTMAFVEGKLLAQLGWALHWVKKLRSHLLITIGATLGPLDLPSPQPDNRGLILGLKASDYYFIDSEELRAWILEQQIDGARIKLVKNALIYHTQGPSLTWVYHHVQNRTIKKNRHRQFGKFFRQMLEISIAK